jgi:hypothetical protein
MVKQHVAESKPAKSPGARYFGRRRFYAAR